MGEGGVRREEWGEGLGWDEGEDGVRGRMG